jgi:hypothetical protein
LKEYGEDKVQTTNNQWLAVKTVVGKKIQWAVMPVSVRVRPAPLKSGGIATNKQKTVWCPDVGN